MTEPFFIAIDGPAGSGKSSVSKEIARRLHFGYLDTGSVYRALAWAVRHSGGDTEVPSDVERVASGFHPSISLEPDDRSVVVNGTDVTDIIRTPEVTAAVRGVAQVLPVRAQMNELFRQTVAGAPLGGVVVEGRDITTVVAPDAPVRILLTAHPEVRAARRAGELADADLAAVAEAIRKRDASDMAVAESVRERSAAVADFLTAAPGVAVVDTTDLTFDESVHAVLALIERRMTDQGDPDGR